MPFNFFKKNDWSTELCFKSFDDSFCCCKQKSLRKKSISHQNVGVATPSKVVLEE